MSGRIYPKGEDKFVQISDKDLADKILIEYKDLIDLIAGSPNEIYYHLGHPRISSQGDRLYTTNFYAETYQFYEVDEIKLRKNSLIIM